jgi:ABC-type multidrug transport system fused ATPase/permease subunit
MDLLDALRILRDSPAFRLATQEMRQRIFLTAGLLLLVTWVGLYAIDFQARLLSFLGHQNSTRGRDFLVLFSLFAGTQCLFEILQWGRRSLQNRVSVSMTQRLRFRVFQKYSQLSYAELQMVSPGEVAQLHASDSAAVAGIWAEGLLSFLATLILTLGVSVFLMIQVGISGILFFGVLVLLIYLAQRFSRQTAPVLQKRAIYSAQRLSVVQEAIRSMLLIKALTVEEQFEKRIKRMNDLEQDMKLSATEISCRYVPVFASLRWFAWAALLMWIVYVPLFTSSPLEPQKIVALVFAVSWYSSLLQDSFLFVGTYLSFIQVGAVSVQRLDRFLNLPLTQPAFFQPSAQQSEGGVLVGLEHVTVAYPTRPGQLALKDVTLSVQQGRLVVVLGPVGSGKSTLLRTLLGELNPQSGKVLRRQGLKVAYLSQDVVLPSASLRDVLRYEFENAPHEDDALKLVLQQVAFGPDLDALSAGLGTPVGERGVTLSGGQKLRVGLGQMSYFSDADVLLMDDPLAALDEATVDILIKRLICGVWASKTRVVSTHRPDLAALADWVVRMDEGRIVEQGPPRTGL